MKTYFSTFPAGFGEIAREALSASLEDVEIVKALDGLLLYKSPNLYSEIKQLPFFTNTFVLLSSINQSKIRVDSTVDALFRDADLRSVTSLIHQERCKTFRLMISRENQTISPNKQLLNRQESIISRVLNLQPNRSLADAEFWFLLRTEGLALFGLRLTGIGSQLKPKYGKGELKGEVAHLLTFLSAPTRSDIFLDPFAGSGAIGLARASSFPYQQIILSDTDTALAREIKNRFPKLDKVKISTHDALVLPSIEDH